MAKKLPYLTPRQRWISLVAFMFFYGATLLVLRRLITFNDGLVVLAAFGVLAFAAAIFSWWADRNCPLLAREELRKRYAMELLDWPTWQAVLMYAVICTAPTILWHAVRFGNDGHYLGVFLAIMLPLGYLAGAVAAYFARQRAAKLLGRCPT